jgi:PIN domain nuclease of toxin-antitoxin system
MAIKYLIDAHALIWYLEDNTKSGSNAKVILDDPQSQLILPTIALA